MNWINRLQQHIALTRTEGIALMTVTGLFLSGLLIEHVWENRATVPQGYYAAADSALAAATRHLGDTLETSSHARSDTADTSDQESSEEPAAARINLNTANVRQLQQLSGIGPVLARRITAYRERNGPFSEIEDLVDVSGIGPKTLENILPLLYMEEITAEEDSLDKQQIEEGSGSG